MGIEEPEVRSRGGGKTSLMVDLLTRTETVEVRSERTDKILVKRLRKGKS